MSTELKMTISERYKYLRMMQKRYRQATKAERGLLLDEIEAMTNCNRKSLVRHMNSDLSRRKRHTQRGRTYGVELQRQREATNPRQLRQEIYEGLKRLHQLPLADPNQADDVRQTLMQNMGVEMERLIGSSLPVTLAGD